eukprot:5625797-Ditylum_brightwellii.AAC.1
MERSNQNGCVDNSNRDGYDNSDDGGDKHLRHLTKADDCCLMERSKQMGCVDDSNRNGFDNIDDDGDKHLTHLSQGVDRCLMERSNINVCVDDGKEGVDNSDDHSDDGGYKLLKHLTQVESIVNLGVCDKHLTHVVKKTPESLISDVT